MMLMKVLLYYQYADILDPQAVRDWQTQICRDLGLKGRILVAEEGLNGTVCGDDDACERYKELTWADARFAEMVFKEDDVDRQVFPRLRVVVRREIVTLGIDPKEISYKERGKYIRPEELHAMYESGEEFYVLDVRNDYESLIGRFRNAITPKIRHFRDFPRVAQELRHLKDKKIVMYCTGGVRCERATAYFRKQGFRDVSHLEGGIVTYAKQYPEGYFEGKMYVFDGRVAVSYAAPGKEKVVSNCWHCGVGADRIVNCGNAECDEQYVVCENCVNRYGKCCSVECGDKAKSHPRPSVYI
jgi:UPF0176 protein